MAEAQCGGLRLHILGPLTAESKEGAFCLGPLKQRMVLAMLLCRANSPVSLRLLTDALWEGNPPRTARKNIQVYISILRKLLDGYGAGDRLHHQSGGYVLRVDEDELDALRFQRLVRDARRAADGDADAPASRLLREALALWQGPPLHEMRLTEPIRVEADRLEARHLRAYEDWAEAELRLGNATAVADTVGDLVERHPERERLRAAQMNALFSQGRQTEALAEYEGLRRLLAAEYGLRPSPAIEALYHAMLSGTWREPGGPFALGGRRTRANVGRSLGTLLPRDLPDFTGRALQLDYLREVLGEPGAEQRLAVLTGPAGSGKTALAVHTAHLLGDAFPDGRVLVRMRDATGGARTLASVLTELGRHGGLGDLGAASTADPEGAVATWRGWLAHRRVLLVLDDVTDEGCVRPLLPDSGTSAVLVTAKTQLAGLTSAHRLRMTPFDIGESLALLGSMVGQERLEASRAAAERLVAATGMLPMAVRVCGLKLAVRRYLPLSEYAARLADSRSVLDELVAGDMDVRPRLASSWRDLSPADRATLRVLGTLPEGPFTLDRAAAALGCAPDDAQRRLESLADAGVLLEPATEVTSHTARYELPRLTHVYAREQVIPRAPEKYQATA